MGGQAAECLDHPYLAEYHDPDDEPVAEDSFNHECPPARPPRAAPTPPPRICRTPRAYARSPLRTLPRRILSTVCDRLRACGRLGRGGRGEAGRDCSKSGAAVVAVS